MSVEGDISTQTGICHLFFDGEMSSFEVLDSGWKYDLIDNHGCILLTALSQFRKICERHNARAAVACVFPYCTRGPTVGKLYCKLCKLLLD